MKKYLLFCGLDYYPDGGWDDFISSGEYEEIVKDKDEIQNMYDWWQIVDLETMKIVFEHRNPG